MYVCVYVCVYASHLQSGHGQQGGGFDGQVFIMIHFHSKVVEGVVHFLLLWVRLTHAYIQYNTKIIKSF